LSHTFSIVASDRREGWVPVALDVLRTELRPPGACRSPAEAGLLGVMGFEWIRTIVIPSLDALESPISESWWILAKGVA
jgi:hypothetical protein